MGYTGCSGQAFGMLGEPRHHPTNFSRVLDDSHMSSIVNLEGMK